jgi:CheY-like chemotaxis protein
MVISHELRTPLSGIIGTAELLLKTSLTDKQQEYVLIQKESGLTLLLLINNILDFSKLEFGGIKIEENDFNLKALINTVLQMVRFQARSRNISVKGEISADLSAWVHGDEARIRQVLLNLLHNAVKFSQNGDVLVRVVRKGLSMDMKSSVKVNETVVQQVQFEVVDYGIGMSEEKLKGAFENNWQNDTSSKRFFDGLGLGLTISKQIINSMQGTIGVRSTSEKGSTFYFTVPLLAVPAPENDNSNEPTAITNGFEDTQIEAKFPIEVPLEVKKRILVAEDNRINQIIIKETLTAAGYDCMIVENGFKAVQMWNDQKFDLILMDCQMPEMDGYEATEKIRTTEMIKNIEVSVPIIALTANVAPGDKERCLNAGMNAYCNKPINSQELNALIKQLTVPNFVHQ